MKNKIAEMLTFEDVVNMGFDSPASSLVDFSDDVYNAASERCTIERDSDFGVEAFKIDGIIFMMKFDFAGPEWFKKEDVEDWDEAAKLFA